MSLTMCAIQPIAIIALLGFTIRELRLRDWNRYYRFLKVFELWLERSNENTPLYHVEKVLGEWTFSIGKIRGVFTPYNFNKTRNNECPKAREARQKLEANAIKLSERVRNFTKGNRKVS